MDALNTELTSTDPYPGGLCVVYDGDCPLCSQFVRMMRLKAAVGAVSLYNARESQNSVVKKLRADGFDLNEGMVVIYNNSIYYGERAVQILYALSTQSNVMNRIGAWWFRSSRRARMSYPVLKFGRRILLFLLGRKGLS